MLGYSGSLLHSDFCTGCGNIIVGGINWVQPDNRFMLSIARLKEDGTADANSVWHINQDDETANDRTPYIDHMKLDGDWLYGTSRSIKMSEAGNYVYFWKL